MRAITVQQHEKNSRAGGVTESLTRNNEALRRQIRRLHEELEAERENVSMLETSATRLFKEKRKLTDEVNVVRAALYSATRARNQYKAEHGKTEQELRKAQTLCAALNAEIEELKAEQINAGVRSAKVTVNGWQDRAGLREELDAKIQTIERMKEEHEAALKDARESLQRSIKEQESLLSRNRELVVKVDQLTADRNLTLSQIKQVEQNYEAELERQQKQAQQLVDSYETELRELLEKCDEKDETIHALAAKLAKAREQRNQYKSDLRKRTEELEELQRTHSAVESELVQAKKTYDVSGAWEQARLKTESRRAELGEHVPVEDYDEMCTFFAVKIKTLTEYIERQREELADQHQRLSLYRSAALGERIDFDDWIHIDVYKRLDKRYRDAMQENEALRYAPRRSKEEWQNLVKAYDDLNAKFERMQKEHDTTIEAMRYVGEVRERQYKELTDINAALHGNIQAMQEQIDDLTSDDLDELRERYNSLSASYVRLHEEMTHYRTAYTVANDLLENARKLLRAEESDLDDSPF